MPALPTVHSTHPGVPERVIRQEKEAKGVRIGKEEADLGLVTGDTRPGLVTPLAASSLSVGLIVNRQGLLTRGPRPSLLCALCSGRVSSVAVDVPAVPTPPSKARRHAPGPQTQVFTCPHRGGGLQKGGEADQDWTRGLPAGPRAPAVEASVRTACGFRLDVPRARPLSSASLPGPRLSLSELCWPPGPPWGSRPARLLLHTDARCLHAHLVTGGLTRPVLSWWRPPLSAGVRPSGCCGGDRAEATRSTEPHLPAGLPLPGPEPWAPGHRDLTSVTGPLGVPVAQPRGVHGALQEGHEPGPQQGWGVPTRRPSQPPPRAGGPRPSPGGHSPAGAPQDGPSPPGPPALQHPAQLQAPGVPGAPGAPRCAGLLPHLARSAPPFVSIFGDNGLGLARTSGPQQAAAPSPLLRADFTADPGMPPSPTSGQEVLRGGGLGRGVPTGLPEGLILHHAPSKPLDWSPTSGLLRDPLGQDPGCEGGHRPCCLRRPLTSSPQSSH